ncbi:MAG: molybdenum cofactor guanylyltransferase [Chthoniobacteraceae bacterium]
MRDPEPIANVNFAAVLLAGGRSTRMGFDKATLLMDGQPLWQRQLDKLRALAPRELFISGRRDGPFAAAEVEIVEDAVPGLGPLGGVAAALRRAESPVVVVLGIDLPAMTATYLAGLVRDGRPAIPKNGNHFEPLAALYPKSALPIAETLLREDDRSMQHFVRTMIGAGLARSRRLSAAELFLFQNINAPEDLG